MDRMDQRLQALERELSRSRRVNRLLFVAVVAVVCVAAAQDNGPDQSRSSAPQRRATVPADAEEPTEKKGAGTIKAEQFILVDRDGRSRMTMQMTDEGPAVNMFDEEGQKRLELSQTGSTSGLRLFDAGEPVVSLRLGHAGEPSALEIKSAHGTAAMKADGFSVRDAADHGRLSLALLNGNYPVLGISQSDQEGPPSIELTAGEGGPSLKMHDSAGYPLVSLVTADGGKTLLNMRHPAHERSLQISNGPKPNDGPTVDFIAPARKDGTGGVLSLLQLGLSKNVQPQMRIVDSTGKTQFVAPAEK